MISRTLENLVFNLVVVFSLFIGALLGGLLKLARIPFDFLLYGLYAAGFALVLNFVSGMFDPAPVIDAGNAARFDWSIPGYVVLGALAAFAAASSPRLTMPQLEFQSFKMPSLNRPQWSQKQKPATPISNAQRVYYTSVLKCGAIIAAADNNVEPREFSALMAFFRIDQDRFADARDIYRGQLSQPEKLSGVLQPFLDEFGEGSAVCETFLVGMCKVAMADNFAHPREILLLKLAGERLGLSSLDITRILLSAKVLEQDSKGAYRGARDLGDDPMTLHTAERKKHLSTLGLQGFPSEAEIKSAYRAQAMKYHPDTLVSRGLSQAELEQAEATMIAINEAYEYLQA